jgi:hypothetical protein
MRYKHRLRSCAVLVVSVAILSVACSGGPSGGGCANDNDCKGDRVCNDGACVDPGTSSSSSSSTGVGGAPSTSSSTSSGTGVGGALSTSSSTSSGMGTGGAASTSSSTSSGGCVPDCAGIECGNDPVCNKPCGSCSGGEVCEGGACVCPASDPYYCASAAPTACWNAPTACSTIVECPGGAWHGCGKPDQTVNCSTDQCDCPAAYPYYCASAAPTACWNAPTACSTIVECPGGVWRSCGKPDLTVNCSTTLCDCPAAYPYYCASAAPTGCWNIATACNTIVECPDGSWHGCSSAQSTYDCATNTCQ